MTENVDVVEKERAKTAQQTPGAEGVQGAVAAAIVAEPARRYRAWVFQGYMVAAVVIFVILAVVAKSVAYFAFDITVAQVVQSFHPGWFNALMLSLTWIGFSPQAWVITAAVIVFLFASGLKWETVVATASVIGSSLLVVVVKTAVDRPRPAAGLVHVVTHLNTYSFPSGHVVYFTTFFGFLFFLAYILLKHSWERSVLLALLGAMILLVGPSRIYVGEHWASDVLAAYLLGSVWLSLSILIYRWGKPRYFVNQPVAKETPA